MKGDAHIFSLPVLEGDKERKFSSAGWYRIVPDPCRGLYNGKDRLKNKPEVFELVYSICNIYH